MKIKLAVVFLFLTVHQNVTAQDNDTVKMISYYMSLANHYQFKNIPDSSFYYHNKALKLSILVGDTAAISNCYTNLGAETFNRGFYDMSEGFLKKAVHLDSLTGNEKHLSNSLSFLGLVHGIRYLDNPQNTAFRDKALDCVRKSISINGDNLARFNAYYALTQYAMWNRQGDSTTYYYKKFCEAAAGIPVQPMKISLDVDYIIYQGKLRKALKYLQDNENVFKNSEISMRFYYEKLTYVSELLGDYRNAHEANKKQFRFQRKISDDNTTRAIAAAEAEKAAALERIKREEEEKIFAVEKKHLKTLSFALATGLFLVAVVVLLFFRMWKIKRKANSVLSEKNMLLSQQKAEIISSIRYAERIQRAAIPSQSDVSAVFPESFVLYRPRDIVSGDYYRALKCGRFSVMITADCTGHGIPGAFLSMLGISSLKEFMTDEKDAENPGTVLDRMRSFIKATLITKTDKMVDDGMDMTICCFDFENMELSYAIANQTAYIIRGSEVIKLKGDKMPVGRYIIEKEHFQTLKVNVCKGDIIYMFSDGLQDQLGGRGTDFGHKFMAKNLQKLLSGTAVHPISEQSEIVEKAFNDWRGDKPQTDDITLVGIRV